MRRNLTSLLKFMLLCFITVVLTAFLYKTYFLVQHMYSDDEKSDRTRYHPRQGAFFMGQDKNMKQMKIDWHDYAYIEYEKKRVGIGEHGVASHSTPAEEADRLRLFLQNGFNGHLSDKIALNRSIADIRHKG